MRLVKTLIPLAFLASSFAAASPIQLRTNHLTNPSLKGIGFTLQNPVTLLPSDTGQQQPQSDIAPLQVSTGPG